MMDFNLILLLVGLGLLAIVILFALWGFLGGLKRELSCDAVFFILLLLAWLIFGNSGILLNYSGSLVGNVRDMLELPARNATLWETVVDYLKTINGLNGEVLLVEGKETYNLIFNIVSGIATLVLLISATLVVVVVTPIIRLISHVVCLIINGVKKKKAKKLAAEKGDNPEEETESVEKPTDDEEDAVLVLKGEDGSDDVVITMDENELPTKPVTKKRVWGAVVGALKGIFLIILLFAPISGIYSVLRTATPQTRELISDLVNGNTEKQTVAESEGPIEMAFDFVDEYGKSGIGKFVESSSYFFGQSFSTLLFDSSAKIKTDSQTIKLREELTVFVKAVNALDGKSKLGAWTDAEFANALEVLKDSQLLPELMPALIEYAYEQKVLREPLAKATQEAAFLNLRNVNWEQDLEKILDGVKVAYKLDFFDKDFNYLTLDPEVLQQVVEIIGTTELINQVMPIAVKTAVKLEAVDNLTGGFNQILNLDAVNWQDELASLVAVYAAFQDYGYTDLEQVTGAETNDLVKHLVVDNFDTTVKILDNIVEMGIFSQVVIPVGQKVLDFTLTKKDGENVNKFADFANIINLRAMTVEDWKADFKSVLEVAKLAINELDALELDPKKMDLESAEAIDAVKQIITKVFDLKLLGDDQTKNDLIIAAVKAFDLLNEEDLFVDKVIINDKNVEEVVKVSIFENVNWKDLTNADGSINIGEVQTLINLVDVYAKFKELDEVDMKEFTFDFVAMLDNDQAVDVLVEALEELVDSELVVQAINPAVNKYLLPITDKFDDDNLVKDIMAQVGSETAALEIIKIVQAVKAASSLGLFKTSDDGLSALNYDRTEDIITIIDTVFDSKLFKGYEGRVIRIIFKATKILDVPKGLLNDIDYAGERDTLVNFIKALEPVLKDPEFKLTDAEGNVQFDKEYLTKPEVFAHLMDAFELVLGTFERDEEGKFIETRGSKLVEALLPYIYDSYLQKLIPAEFAELVEILDIDNLTGEQLAKDLKRIVYIAGQLVEMDVQTVLVNKSITYIDKLENLYNIVDALQDIDMFKSCGNEVFAWTINYLADKFASKYNIEHVNAKDFENVDWDAEGANLKAVLSMAIDFLKINNLNSTEDLTNFINDKKYMSTLFIHNANANRIVDLLSKVVELQTLRVLVPVAFDVVVNELEKAGIDNFWNDQLTGEQLVNDIYKIFDIVKVLVNDMHVVEYWQGNFENDMPLPEATNINKVLDQLFELNLIKGYESSIVKFALTKLVPTNSAITVADFDVYGITDWNNEVKVIEKAIAKVIDILKANNYPLINDVLAIVKENKLADSEFINSLITDQNILAVSELITIVKDAKLVQNILPAALSYGLTVAKDAGYDLSFLEDVTKAELTSDLEVVVNILKTFSEMGGSEIILNKKLSTIDTDKINNIINYVSQLHLVTKHESELFTVLINKGLELAKLTDFTLNAGELNNVNWDNEFTSLKQIVTIVGSMLDENQLQSSDDVIDFIDEVKLNIDFFLLEGNVQHTIDIIEVVANMDLAEVMLPKVINYGVDKLAEKGYDLSFVKETTLTGEEFAQDIVTIVKIARDAIDLGALEIYKGNVVYSFEEALLRDVANQIAKLNILSKHYANWMAFVVNLALDKLVPKSIDFTQRYTAEDFIEISGEQWNKDTDNLGNTLVAVTSLITNVFTEGFTIDKAKAFVEDKKYLQASTLTDENVDLVAAALSNILGLNSINLVVQDFAEWGIEKLYNKNYELNLYFVAPSLTPEKLTNDALVIGEIAKHALHFGALDYVNDKKLENIDLTHVAKIVAELENLFIFKDHRDSWTALAVNQLYKLVGITEKVTNYQFEDIDEATWKHDNELIQSVVVKLNGLFTAKNGLTSLAEIQSFISNKTYATKEFLNNANIDVVVFALQDFFKLDTIDVFFNTVVDFGFTKLYESVNKELYNLDFAKAVITTDALSADVYNIGEIAKNAIAFGAFEYISDKNISNVDLLYIANIVEFASQLNIYANAREEWLSFGFNILFRDVLKVEGRVGSLDFEEISDSNIVSEASKLASAIRSLNDVWANIESLQSLNDINSFISEQKYIDNKVLSDANIDLVVKALESIFQMNLLDPVLPIVADFGLSKSPINVDFIKPQLIKENLEHDIPMIGEIAKAATAFGLVEYLKEKDIAKVQLSYVGTIYEKLNEMYLFTNERINWTVTIANEVLKAIKINKTVDYYMFDEITESQWKASVDTVKAILTDLDKILVEWQLSGLNETINFIKDKGYLTEAALTEGVVKLVAHVATLVVDLEVVKAVLPKIANYAITTLQDKIDLSFVKPFIADNTLDGNALAADVKTLMGIVCDAVDFGALDIYFGRYKTEEFKVDLTHVSNILAKLDKLNILAVAPSKWVALAVNKGMAAAKLNISVEAVDFVYINEEMWHADSINAIEFVNRLKDILASNNLDTYQEIKQFIDQKGYLSAQYVSDANINAIADLLDVMSNINVLEPLYIAGVSYVIDEKVPELKFLQNHIKIGSLNGQMISHDIKVLTSMIRDAVAFGVVEVLYEKNLSNIKLEEVSKIVTKLEDLQTLAIDPIEWLVFAINKGAKVAKLNVSVTVEDYYFMTDAAWHNDNTMILNTIKAVSKILNNANISSFDELMSFINNKNYTLAQYVTEENVNLVADVLSYVGQINSISPILDDLAIIGLDKVKINDVDLSFVKALLENRSLTGKMLSNDLCTISRMVKDLVEFGAIEYFFYQSIDEIKLDKAAEAVAELNNLNLYNVAKSDWFVLGLNKALKAMGINKELTIDDFAGLDLNHEVDSLIAVLNKAAELLTALNLVSSDDVKQFIADKNYLNGQYVKESNINIVSDIVNVLADMKTVQVLLPTLAAWGIGKANISDLSFLKDALDNEEFTGEQLISDVKTVVKMAKLAAEFGIFDAIFDIAIEDMNTALLADLVAEVENLNVFTELRPEWLSLGLNKALAFTGLKYDTLSFGSFLEEDYKADNEKLQKAVVALAEICKAQGLTYASAITGFVKNEEYLKLSLYNDANISLINTALTNLLSTRTFGVVYIDLVHWAVDFVNTKGIDISFINGMYSQEYLVNDVPVILDMVQSAVAFGALEFIKSKEISNINVEHVNAIVANLENLKLFTMFRAEWVTLGVNKLAKAAKLDVVADASTFASFTDQDWLNENTNLQALVSKLGEILNNNNLVKYSDVINFINDKKYALEETYDDSNITLIADTLKIALSFKVVDAIFPQLLSIIVEKAAAVKLDISFLVGKLTTTILKNDVEEFVSIYKSAVKFGLFEFLETKQVKLLNLIYLNPAIAEINNLGLFQISPADWTSSIINCIAQNAKISINTTPADFAGVNWDQESVLFQQMITKFDNFLVETDLVLFSNLKDFIDSGFKPQAVNANAKVATMLVDAVSSAVQLQTVQAITYPLVNFGLTKLQEKGYDFKYLLVTVSNNELVQDINTVLSAAQDLIDFGAVEIAYFNNEIIDYSKKALVYSALEKVVSLNIIDGYDKEVLVTIFNKLGIDSTELSNGVVELDNFVTTLENIIDNAIVILESYNLNTRNDISSFNFKENVKLDDKTNSNLNVIANILDTLAADDLINLVALELSQKYIGDKFNGLASLHSIYNTEVELVKDLRDLSTIMRNIISLNVNDFMNGTIDYPYTDKQHVEVIIDKLFNLNYFNLPGRMESFINNLQKATGFNLSDVDGSKIDLANDSTKIIDMYNYLSRVLGDPEFAFKNKNDWSTKKMDIAFFFERYNFQNEMNAVKSYMDTTIYDQTGAAILIVLVPVLKNVLKDYWVALDLDNYSAEDISNDVPHIQEIMNIIMDLDPMKIYDGQLDYSSLSDKFNSIVEHAEALILFEDRIVPVAELVLRDFVYDKEIAGKVIPAGTFDLTSWEVEEDAKVIKELVADFIALMANESVNSLSETKDYFKTFNVLQLLDNESSFNIVAEMLNKVVGMSIVEANLKALYMTFAVPVLESKQMLQYCDYREATNEELVFDVKALATIANLANNAGAAKIIDGENINYDQTAIVEEILTTVGTMNYAKYHVNTYLDMFRNKVTGFYQYNASYESLDVESDLSLISKAYSELVPILMDANFPLKSIKDFKSIDFKAIINLVYDNLQPAVKVYKYVAQTSLAPYFLATIVETAVNYTPAKFKVVVSQLDPQALLIDEAAADMIKLGDILDNAIYVSHDLSNLAPLKLAIGDMLDLNLIKGKEASILASIINIPGNNVTVEEIEAVLDVDYEYEILCKAIDIIEDILVNNNIATVNKLVSFIKNKDFMNWKNYASLVNFNSGLDLVSTLCDSKVFSLAALPFAKWALKKVSLPERFAELKPILALEKYDNVTFVQDLKKFVELGHEAVDSKLYVYLKSAHRNDVIDWNNSYIDEMIRTATKLNFLSLYGQEVIEFAGNFVKLDFSLYGNEFVEYANEKEAYVNAFNKLKVLLSEANFPYKTAQNYIDLVKGRSSVNWKYFINYRPATLVIDALSELNGTTFSAEIYKVLAMNVATKRLFPGAKFLDPSFMTQAELTDDFATLTKLAKSAVDFIYNEGSFARVGKDSSLENIQAAKDVVKYLGEMNIFKTKYKDIIIAAMNKLGMDTTNVDLTGVDYSFEFANLQVMAEKALVVLADMDIESFKELVSTAKEYKQTLTVEGKKALLRKIKNALVKSDVANIVEFVEAFDLSQIADQVIIPAYNFAVNKYIPAAYRSYLDISGYTDADAASDTHLAAIAVRNLYESQIYKAYTQKIVLTADCIPFVQEMILAGSKMRILDMKKQDLVEFANNFVIKGKLDGLNISNVNLEADGVIVANMVPQLYEVYLHSNSFKFRIDMLGKTMLMENLISLFEQSLTTDTVNTALPWAFRKFVIQRVRTALGTSKFANVTDQQIRDLIDDVVVALHAAKDMGAFSNNGIDLTDSSLTDKVFAVVYENINIGKYQKYFDKLVRNIASYGVLPVDYSVLNTKTEIDTFVDLLKTLKEFVNKYKTVLTTRNFAKLADTTMQADITSLFNKALQSDLVKQVFIQVMNGSTIVVTENYGKIKLFEGMTYNDFMNIALPDLFKMINLANEIGVLNKSIQYKNTSKIMELVDLVVTSQVTKDHLFDLVPPILKRFLKFDITKQQLIDENVNFVQEAQYLDSFFAILSPELNKASINVSDPNTLLTAEFLHALSQAGRELETSNFLRIVIKPIMKKAINKIGATTDVLDFMKVSLDDENYTNVMAMQDYSSILTLIDEAGQINFFSGSLDYANLDGHIDKLLNALFSMNAFTGHEKEVFRTILNKLSFVDTSTIDLDAISDWSVETTEFTEMIATFAKLCADPNFDINNISSSTFDYINIQGMFIDFIDQASDSYIGRQLFIKLYSAKVESNLPSEADGLIDLNTLAPNLWDGEFQKLFNLYNQLGGNGIANLSANNLIKVYDIFFGFNSNVAFQAVTDDPKTWLLKLLDKASFPTLSTGFALNRNGITDTNAVSEITALRNVIVDMTSYMSDPANDSLSAFTYGDIQNSKDYKKLNTTLSNIASSIYLRNLLIGVIGDGIISNSNTSSPLNPRAMLSSTFWAQYNAKAYDENAWNSDEFMTLSMILAVANAMDLKTNSDIFVIDLGYTYNSVASYSNVSHSIAATVEFPSQVNGANQVGLKQLLELMNRSNVFDLSTVGGSTGIIKTFFSTKNIASFNRELGNFTTGYSVQNDVDIADVINCLQLLKSNGFFVAGQDMGTKLKDLDDASTKTILEVLNQSNILRPMLPEITYNAIKKALIETYGGLLSEDQAEAMINQNYPWLANQATDTNYPSASKADWDSEIDHIIRVMNGNFN